MTSMTLEKHLEEIRKSKDDYFKLALYTILPRLQSRDCSTGDRMISAYCLIGLYLPYELSLNPFLSSVKQVLDEEIDVNGDALLVWFLATITKDASSFGHFSKMSLGDVNDEFERTSKPSISQYRNTEKAKEKARTDEQLQALLQKASTSTLNMSEQRKLKENANLINTVDIPPHHIPGIINFNPHIADSVLLPVLGRSPTHLSQLTTLPPQKSVVHVMANLTKSAPDLIKSTILGLFISNAINWINTAEEIEESGVKLLCMFLKTIINQGVLTKEDTIVVEINHFCLAYSKYSDAIALYTQLT